MKHRLKKIRDQVIVITGASSGIGLTTARLAARQGARLVLAARNAEALTQLEQELGAAEGRIATVVADVGTETDVHRIAHTALERFGGFDTWVNNAGVSIYGRLEQVSTEDHRRLMETNFWGTVYGSVVAARHFKERFGRNASEQGHSGALVNIGSVLSDRAVPLQGMYSASKHAVKGFTEALRMELEEERAPVSVTLVKPSAIDTPYTAHAKNYMDEFPKNPPPVYAPDVVARAILYAAEHPQRDIVVGGGGRAIVAFGSGAPRLADRVMEATMFRMQHSGRPPLPRESNALHRTSGDTLRERGDYQGHVAESSLYTAAAQRPVMTLAIAAGLAVVLGAVMSATVGTTKARRQGSRSRVRPEEAYGREFE